MRDSEFIEGMPTISEGLLAIETDFTKFPMLTCDPATARGCGGCSPTRELLNRIICGVVPKNVDLVDLETGMELDLG